MQKLDVADIIEATGGQLISGERDFVISEITTDSRKAGVNMLFVPLVGENNDAHDYIGNAFEKDNFSIELFSVRTGQSALYLTITLSGPTKIITKLLPKSTATAT